MKSSHLARALVTGIVCIAGVATALAGFAATDTFLPMVGRQAGIFPSNWYTTVWIYNPATEAATARIYLLVRNTANPTPPFVDVLVAPGDTEKLENVVESLFHQQVFGALRVTCDTQKLVVTSRVYSKGAGAGEKNSAGQDFAGVPASFAIGAGEKTQVLGVFQTEPAVDSDYRFNFGFVETTGHTTNVRVTAFDQTGLSQGFANLQVREFSQRQVAFKDYFPTVSTENVRLEVEVTSGTGKIIAYGSGIANASQDPTTFEMQYADKLLGIATVQHDVTLTGDGTAGAPLGLANGAVTLAKLATTNAPTPAPEGGVSALLSITPKVLTTTDGSSLSWQPQTAGDITAVNTAPGSGLTGGVASGDANLAVASLGITTGMLADGAVARGKLAATGAGTAGQALGTDGSGLVWQAGGTITGVTAGTGLTGGGTSGEVTVGVAVPLVLSGSTADQIIDVKQTGSGAGLSATRGVQVARLADASAAVYGEATTLDGVLGLSGSGVGAHGSSNSGAGVKGESNLSNGVQGWSNTGDGVYGVTTGSSGSGVGVRGIGGSNGVGVHGDSTGSFGVYGTSSDGDGVYGSASGSGVGVRGNSASGTGVFGVSTTIGVEGNGNWGVYGGSSTNIGVRGAGVTSGVSGYVNTYGNGVEGQSTNGNGVRGDSTNGNGVYGGSSASYGFAAVFGDGRGLHSTGVAGYAVAGAEQQAGWFQGNVNVTGTLTAGVKPFKIDHPLDPEHKYLYHVAVESPDMMDIYNGNVALDATGEATIELPAWFEALNRDFRYQLTAIGKPGPNLYVAEEIAAGRFKIAGGAAGAKVSWQVTGIRQDPFANAHRVPVEEEKPAIEQGSYLHPDAYGQPEERGVDWARNPDAMKAMKEAREKAGAEQH